MKLLKGLGIGLCSLVLCLLVAPKTKANEQDSKAVVTFTVPVEVPGVGAQSLPAGTYLFKALESSQDRDIIQISNPDGTHVFATFLGVPNSRLKAPDLITVMFTDLPAADPQALKAWYCPVRAWGDQIVYEKSRATQLAKETNEPVLSTSVILSISSVDVLKTASIEAVSPTGETVAMAQVVDAPLMVAPALAIAAVPAAATTPDPTGGSTSATGTVPIVQPVAATETPVAAGTPVAVVPTAATVAPAATEPTVAVAPVTAPEPAVATEPVVATTPTAAVEPPAASASTPAGEPASAPAPVVVTEPTVAVAPVAPSESPATAQPATTAEPTATAAAAPAPATEMATATLPKTASYLPLIGMAGLFMLGAGLLLTGLIKRSA